MTRVQKCLARCLMPKGRIYLYTTAFFCCLKQFDSLVCNHVTKLPVSKQMIFFSQRSSQNLYKNIITFLEEGETFVLWYLHGRREVSYKPAIQQTSHLLGSISGTCRVRQGLPPWLRLDTRFGFCAWRLHITLNLVFPAVLWSYNMIYNYLLCTDKQFVCSGHLFYRENGENEEWYNKLHSWKRV